MFTTINRRAMLRGLPAAAIAATAALPASAVNDPDAELLALIARYPVVNDQYIEAQDRAASILFEVRRSTWFPARIAVAGRRTMPRSAEELRERFHNRPAKLKSALRALEAWQREVDRALAATDYPALKRETDRLQAVRDNLWDRIVNTRAVTARGMLAKFDGMSDAFADDACASVYDDLRELAGRVAS